MDPWGNSSNSMASTLLANGEKDASLVAGFDDHFQSSSSSVTFQKLPDSDQYLANLERKLAKIQKKDTSQLAEKRKMLSSAKSSRDTHLEQFLASENRLSTTDYDEDSNIPVETLSNSLMRLVAPHRQALVMGELIELLKADELSSENQLDADSPIGEESRDSSEKSL